MKKFISILLVAMMVVSLAVIGVNAETPQGTAVGTAAELASMTADGKYYLTADITATGTIAEFNGTLDGNGHKITLAAPLFETVNATVKNLTLEGTVVYTTPNDKGTAYGTLANNATGGTYTAIVNNATPTTADGYVGMIGSVKAGDAAVTMTFEGCLNTTARKGIYIGGMVGQMTGKSKTERNTLTFTNCVNKGDLDATTAHASNTVRAGGMVGYLTHTDLIANGCVNYGNIVSGKDNTINTCAGGVLGYNTSDNANMLMTFTKCVNFGNFTDDKTYSKGLNYVGGMVGQAKCALNVTDCVNFGDISGRAAVGGMVGSSTYNVNFVGCVNYGDITTYTGKAGGIGGNMGAEKKNGVTVYDSCANFGAISAVEDGTATGADGAGGMAGYQYGSGSNINAKFVNCLSAGPVTSTTWAAGLVPYFNTPDLEATNNIIACTVTSTNRQGYDKVVTAVALLYNDNSENNVEKVNNNYVVGTPCEYGVINKWDHDGDHANAKIYTVAEAATAGFLKVDTLENAVNAVNTAAGKTLYTVANGKATHAAVVEVAEVPSTCTTLGTTAGYKIVVLDNMVVGCEPLTELAAHKYVEGVCDVCEAPDPNYVPPTQPGDTPETGDMTWAIVVVALAAVLGSAVVIGRKARD